MELQLGLALPSSAIKGFDFDLNSYVFESNGSNFEPDYKYSSNSNYDNKKRSFDDAFEQDRVVPQTLPLLLWNKQPNDEDDDDDTNKDTAENDSSLGSNNTVDEDGVVGWPPVKTKRKKLKKNNGSNSMFVKVKMEGLAIARKIDLTLHDSFQTLTTTLITMFDIWNENSNNYKLAYQDREGDWLIADQDMPWRTFIRTVQRLKLMKSIN